ncbi:hypothetical protein GCM10025760_20780 [Microbacterium yannicii]|uniref:Uncharacterized protein n=1 Tax=Microbacterium yannicii TaxID=671622 RepID=A0ABP9MCD3_9MICO
MHVGAIVPATPSPGLGTCPVEYELDAAGEPMLDATVLLAGALTLAPWLPLLSGSSLSAGVARGIGQRADLALIATRIPGERMAECNAALNIARSVSALLDAARGSHG